MKSNSSPGRVRQNRLYKPIGSSNWQEKEAVSKSYVVPKQTKQGSRLDYLTSNRDKRRLILEERPFNTLPDSLQSSDDDDSNVIIDNQNENYRIKPVPAKSVPKNFQKQNIPFEKLIKIKNESMASINGFKEVIEQTIPLRESDFSTIYCRAHDGVICDQVNPHSLEVIC